MYLLVVNVISKSVLLNIHSTKYSNICLQYSYRLCGIRQKNDSTNNKTFICFIKTELYHREIY